MAFYPAINLVDIIIDEVALEGLDGITLEALETRLTYRFHDEPPVSQSFLNQVWSICTKVKEFFFYQLESPREKLVVFDRYEFVDPDLGTILEPEVLPKDIYPHFPIHDVLTGNKGSCSTYYSRKDITDIVRNLSLTEVMEKYNATLVIVASQSVREHALMGDIVCPTLELNVIHYCFLERVGRSRYHGEVTQGKISLSALNEDSKSLFYYRKYLLRYKLITKQLHHQKSGGQGCTGSLLHLPRFYVERKPKVIYLAEEIIKILKAKASGVAEYNEIRKKLQLENPIKKLFKTSFFQKVVKTDLRVPYTTLYPNADSSESQQRSNISKEKTIRVVQLIDPNVDITDLWGKDEIQEDETPSNVVISHHKYNVPYLKQANIIIEQCKREGISQAELAKVMGLTRLQSRTFVRNMVKANIIATYMNDMGRQRLTTYVSKKFEKSSKMSKQFKKEMHKIKEFTKSIRNETNINIKKDDNSNKHEDDLSEIHNINEKIDSTNTKSDVKIVYDVQAAESFLATVQMKVKFDLVNKILNKYNMAKCCVRYKCTSKNLCGLNKTNLPPLSPNLLTNNPEAASLYKNIKTKLVSQGSDREKKSNETCGFMEDVKNLEKNQFSGITYRLLKRANMIIECVKEYQVIDDMGKLMKMINEEEGREGYDVKIDKKSLIRLLQKLAKDNFVKSKKLTLTADGKEKILTFICDPHIDTDHTVIKSAVEQAKLRFCLMGMHETRSSSKLNSDKSSNKSSSNELEECNKDSDALPKKLGIPPTPRKHDSKAGRRYGYSPKFLRMQELHVLLYYLIYDQSEKQISSKSQQIQTLRNNGYEISDELAEQMGPVFCTEVGWRMFIPPLPRHAGWPEGWALFCDILLRIPLSIFTKLHNVTPIVPGLNDYLNHPIKKHFLVKDIPAHIRKILLLSRKYIFNIHDTVTRLCYIGLVQFGPQKLKEKDQVFLYLNRCTQLMDTTSSTPSYHKIEDKEYPIQRYVFHDIQTVEKYWHDMWKICVNTNLGGRLVVQGKDILLENLMKKSELMQAATVRTPEEARNCDTGAIPGDRQGAAGIDSAFFAHLPRNWNWSTSRPHAKVKSEPKNTVHERDVYLSKVAIDPVKFAECPALKKISGPISLNATELRKKSQQQSNKTAEAQRKKETAKNEMVILPVKSVTQKSYVRRVLPRKNSTRRRVKYDETDFRALQRMHKLRVDWEPREDNILLVCKVAMMYLCPKQRKQIVSFTAVRDVLRSHSYTSYNKTSRACQRRLMYMLRKPETIKSVALGVEEVKENFYISKRFGGIVDKIKAECDDVNEYERRVIEAFKELVAYIARKFYDISEVGSKEPISVPKTIQEFNIFYKVVHPKKRFNNQGFTSDVRHINEVHAATINSVIHSSMCCRKNRSSWTYQLFKVYQQYSETLLRNAMLKIRSDQLVAVKKNHLYGNKRYMNCMPMSSSQYQLSTNYIYKFQTKWPYDIFGESYDVFVKLLQWHDNRHKDDLTFSACSGTELHPVTGGIIAVIQDYITQGYLDFDVEIPDQIITLDPRLQEKDETYLRIAQRYQDIMASLDYADLKKDDTSFETYVNMRRDNLPTKKKNRRKTKSRKPPEEMAIDYDNLSPDSDIQSNEDLAVNFDNRDEIDDDVDVNCEDHDNDSGGFPQKEGDNHLEHSFSERVRPCKRTISESEDKDFTPKRLKLHDESTVEETTVFNENEPPLNRGEPNLQESICKQEIRISNIAESTLQQTHTATSNEEGAANSKKCQDYTGTRTNEIINNSKSVTTYINPHSRLDDKVDVRKRHTRIALLQMREELNDLSLTESHHAHECFVVNMFKILYSLRSDCSDSTDTFKGYTVCADLIPLTLKHVNEFLQKLKKFIVFPKNIIAYSDYKKAIVNTPPYSWDKIDAVYKFVRDRRELGATIYELKDKFECSLAKELYNIITFLQENYLFLRSGVTAVRYIHHRYADPWLINSYKIYRLEREAMLPLPKGSVYELKQQPIESENVNASTSNDCNQISPASVEPPLGKNSSPEEIPEVSSEVNSEVNPEVNSEVNSEVSPEVNSEVKSEISPEVNLEVNLEVNPEVNPVTNNDKNERCGKGTLSSDSEDEQSPCIKKRLQRKRTSLLPQKEIYRAAQQLDFTTAEEIRVIIRPWVRIDGVLNRRVLDRMLGSILSYCLTHPGASLAKIQNRHVPALQPMHTRELVEMLIELKCVEKKIVRKPRVTLLSKPKVIISLNDEWANEEEIFIEPVMGATLKYSIFLSTKSYTSDFMS